MCWLVSFLQMMVHHPEKTQWKERITVFYMPSLFFNYLLGEGQSHSVDAEVKGHLLGVHFLLTYRSLYRSWRSIRVIQLGNTSLSTELSPQPLSVSVL